MSNGKHPKRSLILAGGGLKVAFQAGVLEVWLDEAGLVFDHADAASGGAFNLAMYCQGMSGATIANNWRTLDPNLGTDFNWKEYFNPLYAASFFTYDRFRTKVFPGWGLDWNLIRGSKREATFNVYNFSKHELEVITPDRMTEDFLVAAVSLPMFFPPVYLNGDTYIDAVFVTDANLEEAIARGADELWIIWTVSDQGEWRDGFIAQYFQIIEAAANGHFRRILRRIETNNAAVSAGRVGEFGRSIAIKMLKAEVPLHYLVNFSSDRLIETVNRGVAAARAWCRAENISIKTGQKAYPLEVQSAFTALRFTEEMKGYLEFGETDYDKGFKEGKRKGTLTLLHLMINIQGVDRFVTDPTHEAAAEGYVDCPPLGGRLAVEWGTFNLFTDEGDPSRKHMVYRLYLTDAKGQEYTLRGVKGIRDDPTFDVWSDTTTLYTRILRGKVAPAEEPQASILASGILRLHMYDFLRQLTTFRIEGPTVADRAAALARFGRLFLGKLWDVYARNVLSPGPF